MKRFIIKIGLFFIIVALMDYGYGLFSKYMVANAHSGSTAIFNRILKENENDLMIMGSSRCVCHYDDQLLSDSLGLRAVNVGYKGNGIILMYGRYRIIPKEHKPKLLIYDVEPSFDIVEYANDDNNRRYLSTLKAFYEEPGISEIFSKVDCIEPLKMHSQMYRFNSELFNLLGNYFRHDNNESFFQPSHSQFVEAQNEDNDGILAVDSLKLYYFEKLMDETKEDGVTLIVVASPKYSASNYEVLQPLVELCEKNEVPFWNYYLDMHDTRWFCNINHLNDDGAIEFSKIIANRVKTELLK